MKSGNHPDGICAGFLIPHPPIIVPGVGKGKERAAVATINACREAARETALLGCDTVVLFSPHAPLYRDHVYVYGGSFVEGSFASFGADDARYRFECDTVLRDKLIDLLAEEGISAGSNPDQELDHGALVPLHFLQEAFKSPIRVVIVASAAFDPEKQYRIGTLVRKAALEAGRMICIIASGDMSHKVSPDSPYGAAKEGAVFDRKITEALEASDRDALLGIDASLREKAAECGYGSIVILCGAFDGLPLETHLLGYEAPFGIGYCVASFLPGKAVVTVAGMNDSADLRVRIARLTIDNLVREGRTTRMEDLRILCDRPADISLIEELSRDRAGVFVSIKKSGDLRGCIGTIAPTAPCIAEEIIRNAVSASTMDPRFDPVEADELPLLVISVDVLGAPEPVASRNDLDPARWGVIVSARGRRGLLLPDLEGVDTVDEQLSIACRKGGIAPGEAFSMERFSVTRYR